MYRYRYINKFSQFGRTNCTLILDDLEGEMQSIRIEKEFNTPIENLDDETLYQEASKEIQIAQHNYNLQQAALEEQAIQEEISTGDE